MECKGSSGSLDFRQIHAWRRDTLNSQQRHTCCALFLRYYETLCAAAEGCEFKVFPPFIGI